MRAHSRVPLSRIGPHSRSVRLHRVSSEGSLQYQDGLVVTADRRLLGSRCIALWEYTRVQSIGSYERGRMFQMTVNMVLPQKCMSRIYSSEAGRRITDLSEHTA